MPGVKRCYGLVRDVLNPVIDGLRRNGKIEFIHVRHENAVRHEECESGRARSRPVIGAGFN
jgi:thiamine pyrophosphate-dependent acetolactate synthase large subunit-like protein